ncbi:co-chaperone DjlA [Rosenbergiella australiborealis]|uniref:Co-chaperone protein DjlA n=1 Tax=Rosenbergiella australiborealis TaxID=1544696 RepID=A0ABS5T1D5_9GAMM|nr:co-chaperone DjlA [Rosenbergiella australiborealis]MBT0726154.1 co-chaperone DjlA [Rosenbergiella australiborealis]
MRYRGKVIGFLLGLFSGIGFWGIIGGLLLGHLIDSVMANAGLGFKNNANSRQNLFFITTFQVMGHLTKSKGRVTEADIQLASSIMDRMQLQGEARQLAQQAFREGKQSEFPLRDKLRQFRQACMGRIDLIKIFLEIQIQAALADGELHPNEQQVLYIIAEELGISRQQFDLFISMMTGGNHFGQQGYSQQNSGFRSASPGPTLEDACSVLGVSVQDDALTIKRAYRKLMSEHHPDKLVAKGLPPEMMTLAKEKAQKIQSAYELIRTQKGF